MTERFWELLAKYWGDSITKEEKAELEQLLLEHPDYWLKAGILEQLSYKAIAPLSSNELEGLADKVNERINLEKVPVDTSGKDGQNEEGIPAETMPEGKRTGWKKWGLTAGLAIILVLAISAINILRHSYHRPEAIAWKKVTTAPGTKTSIILPDGSTIWLNAGSILRYPENFNEKSREVYLSGEGYFKVKHNALKPFIIHTNKMKVKDLGTEFDVRAYPDESFSETSLIKGAVEVDILEGDRMQKILLKPSQKITVCNKEPPALKTHQNDHSGPVPKADTLYDNVSLKKIRPFEGVAIPEIAWKEDKLVFQDETFGLLATRLERWYGIKITILDQQLTQRHFTGRADNVSLEKLLMILQQIVPFTYTIQGQEVVIH